MLKGETMRITIELDDLQGSEFKLLRREIVSHITSKVALTKLADSDDFDVVEGVAGNIHTPKSVLDKLAHDDNSFIRMCVAKNASTSAKILDVLAEDEEYVVRREVAGNPKASEQTLIRCAKRTDGYRIKLNPNIPKEVLDNILDKELLELYEYELEWILSNPLTPIGVFYTLAKRGTEDARYAVGKSIRTPKKILRKLSKDEESRVRQAVAGNPHTPPDVLRSMVNDKDNYVILALARNLETPRDVLDYIIACGREFFSEVFEAVASNIRTNPETLEKLSKDYPIYVASNPSTPAKVLWMFCKDKDAATGVRCSLAKNPKLPNELIQELIKDKYYGVRLALTRNEFVSDECMKLLAEDSNPHVRCAARKTLERRELNKA